MTLINTISLFSGAGGMDIGFEKAGFSVTWANEYDNTIVPSYINYFKNTILDNRSICEIPNEDIPKNIIGIIGGPPCQSWSEAGAKRGINDSKGKLFYQYLRVIKYCKPKFFVAENVHGLIHSRNRDSFDKIIKAFENADYRINWKLVNAKNYDVPQDRKRVFIIGYHSSLQRSFEFPKELKHKKNLRDAIGNLHNLKVGKTKKIKNHEFYNGGYSPIFLSRNRVRAWNEQSFTILATDRHIPFHPQAPKMIKVKNENLRQFAKGHEKKYRRLTVRECARIQTFPDDYHFIYDHIRNGYKMVGNAVPVNLAYHIAKNIMQDIKEFIS